MYGSANYMEDYKFLHVLSLTICDFSLNCRFSECDLLINTSPAYVKILKNYRFPRHTKKLFVPLLKTASDRKECQDTQDFY